MMHTGSGGALEMLDAFEKSGLPAFMAGESIFCEIDHGSYCLLDLKVKRIETK